MKKIFNLLMPIAIFCAISGTAITVAAPQVASAANACTKSFMGFPTWYRNISEVQDGECVVKDPGSVGLPVFILQIALNIVDIGVVAVAYLSGALILYGGFKFILSQGDSDKMATARKTLMNASIGLVISIGSVAIVRFITSKLSIGVGIKEIPIADLIANILSTVYFAVGAVSVMVIIISGFTFVTGGSNPNSVAKAKNAILYSVIGIVVSLAAFAITQFIAGRF